MKYYFAFILMLSGLILSNCENKTPNVAGDNQQVMEEDSARAQAKVYFKKLGSNLKTNLKQQMQLDSTGLKALSFCNVAAMPLTDEMNAEIGNDFSPKSTPIQLRRSALKVRNPKNKPDQMDMDVMKAYLMSDSKKSTDVVKTKDGYRVYKPLFIEESCLKCHGEIASIDASVVSRLKELYPMDEALGYKLGEFRGAMIAEIKN